jgi:cytochrome d ubiquinol oxidase subunit I
VPGATVAGTLALFVVTYCIVFWFGIYYINRLVNGGPDSPIAKSAEGFTNSRWPA